MNSRRFMFAHPKNLTTTPMGQSLARFWGEGLEQCRHDRFGSLEEVRWPGANVPDQGEPAIHDRLVPQAEVANRDPRRSRAAVVKPDSTNLGVHWSVDGKLVLQILFDRGISDR